MAMPTIPLEKLRFMDGLSTEFNSMAEMITTRAYEIPQRTYVIYYNRRYTYAQTNAKANQVANFLKEKGVVKGDIVSLMIMNSPEVYDTMFGAQKIGAVAGSINFALKGPEIAYVLDHAKPKVVFVSSEFMADFAKGYKTAKQKPLVVEVETDTTHEENLAWITLAEILKNYPATEALVSQKPNDPFLLLYSSGTTGRPKGIMISNRSQLSVCRNLACTGIVQGNDVMLILLPMFHTNPICVWTYPLAFAGQTVCIRKAFSPQDFWSAIVDNKITILMGVPAMYNYVYYSIDPQKIDRSRLKLKWAFSGAAPLSKELIEGFKEKFNVDIIEGYGLTEGTGVSTLNPPLGLRKPGSVGLAYPEQQVAIMDENLKQMPVGQRGEVCIKGPNVMLEYLHNDHATTETLKDGWLHTGDVGTMDEDGYFYIVDRKIDMINRGGENIYPREIEIQLEAHPDIVAVAVIGVPDEALGERVKAVIETSRPEILTSEDIKAFLKEKLARYKIPEIVEFMDQIPRNPTGKILKKTLKQMEHEIAPK
jgi:long-chain acyl-CoA synthetase